MEWRAVCQGQPFVFFSPDGKNFQAVTLPNAPGQASQLQVVAGTGDFAVAADANETTASSGQELLWQSSDGVTWAPTAAPPSDQQAGTQIVGYLGVHLTMVADNDAGPAVATLVGDQWSEASLDQVLGPIPANDTVQADSAAIGPFGIALVASEQPSASSTQIALGKASATAPGPIVVDQRLLVSRDGITWSNQSLDQLAGATSNDVANLAVTANRFIVTAQLAGTMTNLPTPEVVLVGTAR